MQRLIWYDTFYVTKGSHKASDYLTYAETACHKYA
jgi:hypothetical protein